MSVIASGQAITFISLNLLLNKVDQLYESGQNARTAARLLEKSTPGLVNQNFPDELSKNFLCEVVRWGDGHRFVDRAIDRNKPDDIANALREAHQLGCQAKLAEAVSRVAQLEFVGHSFASKVVRIMFPDQAATLDSRLRDKLGYRPNNRDYQRFLDDMHNVKTAIRGSSLVGNDLRGSLRLCDAEMIVYAAL